MYNEKTFILAVLLVLQNNFPPMIVYLVNEIVSLVHNLGQGFHKNADSSQNLRQHSRNILAMSFTGKFGQICQDHQQGSQPGLRSKSENHPRVWLGFILNPLFISDRILSRIPKKSKTIFSRLLEHSKIQAVNTIWTIF